MDEMLHYAESLEPGLSRALNVGRKRAHVTQLAVSQEGSPVIGEPRWRMDDVTRLTAERDEARQEALRLRRALTGLLGHFHLAYDGDTPLNYTTADLAHDELASYRSALDIKAGE